MSMFQTQVMPIEPGSRCKYPAFAPLDLVGIGIKALRTEITVLFSTFFQGSIGGNQVVDFRQSDGCGRFVGSERMEQRETASHVHFLGVFQFILHV